MRRFFTLFCFAAMSISSNAQRLFVEDFNYAVGPLTDANGAVNGNVSGSNWTNFSGTGNYLFVVPGNLSYPNYFTGPSANSNMLKTKSNPTSSEDVFRAFTSQTSGTVYCSFLTRMDSIENLGSNTSAGEYYVAFLPTSSTGDFRGRVVVRKGSVPNTFNFGVNTTSTTTSNPTNPVTWAPLDYDSGVVYHVTLAYQFVAGPNNDLAKLWINQPFSATEPVPTAMATFPLAVEPTELGKLVIRQAAFNTPNAAIDAIVVATNYADASLPLNLTSFKAAFNGKTTQIKWTTENEVNVSGFSIEKSLDGSNFSQLEFVNAKNNSIQNTYTLDDTKVKGGTTYYRLKLVDKNGVFKYSSVVTVRNKMSIKAEVFPNPAKNNLTVSHGEAEAGATIRIMSLDGKQIKSLKLVNGSTQTNLSVSDLVKGNYMVVFENSGSKSVTQFTKQ